MRGPVSHPGTDRATEPREEEVLRCRSRSHQPEIAQDLYVSISTVKAHVAAIMTKIGARNRVEIAIWAYETGRLPN